ARAQAAFAVSGVLPKMPMVPRRHGPWLGMVVCHPQPAIRKGTAVRGGCAGSVKHLAQSIFAAVKAGILSGPLLDPLHECDRLRHAHRSTGIMAVLFEIEHKQHAGPAF